MKTKKRFEKPMAAVNAVALLLIMLLAACSSPDSGNLAGATPPPPPAAHAPPPMSSQLPPRELREPVQINSSCRTSADCAVKNVGNCCGEQPACVNKDSPTDPAAVQAQCQAKGMMGVCGFKPVTACQCDNGQCVDASPRQGDLRGPKLPAEPVR